MRQRPACFFITGSSGVGKSAILPLLKKKLGAQYDVHDFDEKLTKKVAMNPKMVEAWQNETITFWKNKALKNSLRNTRTVIVGLVYPHAVTKMKPSVPCGFCFLDASEAALTKRLMKHRFSNAQKRKNLFVATGLTPQQFIKDNRATIARLRKEIVQVKGMTINTSHDTVRQSAEKICRWVIT